MALIPVLMLLAVPLTAQVTVDDLATSQGPISSTGPTGFGVAISGSALGGDRDLEVVRLSGSGTVTAQVSGPLLTFATVAGDTGRALFAWDGVDGAPSINPTGLGGQDLTAGGHDALRFIINQGTPGLQLAVEVYSDATHTSAFAFSLPLLASPTEFILPYSDFISSQGSLGADFSSVGAITLLIESLDGAGGDLELMGPINTTVAAPVVKAIKDDLAFPAGTPLITATVAPGGAMTYRITITNTGASAADVQLDDLLDSIDNVSSGAPLNLRSTPIAIDDRYDHCGNSTLVADGSAPAVEGLLNNDNDPDGDPLTVVAIQSPADQGGTVTLDDANNGYFTYVPPAGFRGTDTFTYTIEDDDSNQVTATGVISIPSLVWFVDSSDSGSDEGTQANPFQDLTRLNGAVANLDGPGDVIFVYQGSGPYAGGLPLENDQKLLGSPAGLNECVAVPIAPSGTRPVITNAAGVGITLAADNTIDSVNIDGTSGAGLSGSSIGTATVANSNVTNAGGAAVDFDGGTMAMSFGSLSSAGTNAERGLDLTNLSGSFAVSGSTSLTNPTATGIRVQNAATGTTFDFGAATITGAAGDGIDLLTGNDATFTFDTLSVTTSSGAGLLANSSGTVNINSTGATINATGGPAVDIASTTGQTNGAGGWTFNSLSSSSSATDGIRLVSLTSSLTATTCTISGSADIGVELFNNAGTIGINGGTVGSVTNNAVEINGGAGNITISANITNSSGRSVNVANRSGGTVNIAGTINDTGTGINVASNTAGTTTFSGSSKVINTGTSQAVTVATNSGHTISFTGGGLDIDTTTAAGFSATGGATAVTVEGTGNIINSTTGTALNVVSTTIGGNGLTFQSLSADGGANGIFLNSTGTNAGLTVTGTGAAATGGTIRNMTGGDGTTSGIGIYLNQTRTISLSWMQLNDHQNFAIRGVNVTGFTLADSVINGSNGTSTAADEGCVSFDELLGSASFSNNTISGGFEDNIVVTNTGGALDRMKVLGGTIGLNHNNGNDGILVESQSSAVFKISVIGVSFLGARGDMVQCNCLGTSVMDCVVQNNSFNNTHPNIVSGGGGITISGGSATSNINMTYNVSGSEPGAQTFSGSNGNAITANYVAGAGTVTGTIRNNAVGVSGVEDSGSVFGSGISVGASQKVVHTVTIDNNTIREVGFGGIDVIANVDVGFNATIINNNVNQMGKFGFAALTAMFGGAGTETGTLCMDIRDNIFDNSAAPWGGNAVYLDQLSAAGNHNLPGYGGSANGEFAYLCSPTGTASAGINTYLAGRGNTMTNGPYPVIAGGVDATLVCGVTGAGASCP
jgi:hypothetical protein